MSDSAARESHNNGAVRHGCVMAVAPNEKAPANRGLDGAAGAPRAYFAAAS